MVQQGLDSAPAELAIRDDREAQVELKAHNGGDARVLARAQLVCAALARSVRRARLQERVGALERADVLRAGDTHGSY